MERVREAKSLLDAAVQENDQDGIKEAMALLQQISMTGDILRATRIQASLKRGREVLKSAGAPELPEIRKLIKRYNKLQKSFAKTVKHERLAKEAPSSAGSVAAGQQGERQTTVLRLKRSDGTDDLTVIDGASDAAAPTDSPSHEAPFTASELQQFGEPIPPEPRSERAPWTPTRRWLRVDGTKGPGNRWFPWTAHVPLRKANDQRIAIGPYVVPS